MQRDLRVLKPEHNMGVDIRSSKAPPLPLLSKTISKAGVNIPLAYIRRHPTSSIPSKETLSNFLSLQSLAHRLGKAGLLALPEG